MRVKKLTGENPFFSAFLLYLILTFLPKIISDSLSLGFISDLLVSYVLPGILGLIAAQILYGGGFPRVSGTAKSILYSAPAVIFVAVNIIVSRGFNITSNKIFLCLAVAFSEESLARAMLQKAAESEFSGRKKDIRYACILSSAVFGLVHLANLGSYGISTVLFQVLYTAVIGLIFSLSKLKTGSIFGSIIWHFLINLTA